MKIWNKLKNIFKKKNQPQKKLSDKELLQESIQNYLFIIKLQYYQQEIEGGAEPHDADVTSTHKAIRFYQDRLSEIAYANIKTENLNEYCIIEDEFTFGLWQLVLEKCVENEKYEAAAIISKKIEEYK